MSFDLRNQLSDLDKKIILNYITAFGDENGLPEEYFVGVDTFLENWAKSKLKLYHFLGNQLIIKVPFSCEKNEEGLEAEVRALLFHNIFLNNFSDFLFEKIQKDRKYSELSEEERKLLTVFDRKKTYIDNKINFNLKIKSNKYKKMLQLSKDMKPIRAIQKILKYFDAPKFLLDSFEEFRCEHSLIYNDKISKDNLVLSIHPMDFMTMSDNNNNWESCMSWVDNGYFHTGTVEMMNSNIVVCAYLESKAPFVFRDDIDETRKNILDNINKVMGEPDEEWSWNSKKWRQLFYINKDIIVSGKSYPYTNDIMTKKVLEILRELAFKNNHWTYKYGIEKYYDMKYIWSTFRVDKQREWASLGVNKKKNIIFDSKIMYNDMINDRDYNYWCIRNPVKKTKIISYSGKANCLCCNETLQTKRENFMNFNEEYHNNNTLICRSCYDSSKCPSCNKPFSQIYKFVFKGGEIICCENCFNDYRKCPCCNKNVISKNYLCYDVTPSVDMEVSVDCNKKETTSEMEAIIIRVCPKCAKNEELLNKKLGINLTPRHERMPYSYHTHGTSHLPLESFLPFTKDNLKPIEIISKVPVPKNIKNKVDF